MAVYLLDTDVGTDVDDALAIAYLASRRDVELAGVTTVHGNAPLRAEIARGLLQAADGRSRSWQVGRRRSAAARLPIFTGTNSGAMRAWGSCRPRRNFRQTGTRSG